jgi:F420-0:gamma-glutamyl ligase
VEAGAMTIFELLDESISELKNGMIVAITSKVVSLCESQVVPVGSVDKEELIVEESEYYLPGQTSRFGHRTIAHHTLVSGAGIDESNAKDNYVLLPKDPQKNANEIRQYLRTRFKLQKIGVIITDSVSTPLRLGASGTALSWSGFDPLKNYRGQPDLFGRPFKVSRADIAGGLAAAAVLVMGEGAEQTPIALIEDADFVKFQNRNPSKEELEYMNFSLDEDIFSPLLKFTSWQKGKKRYK